MVKEQVEKLSNGLYWFNDSMGKHYLFYNVPNSESVYLIGVIIKDIFYLKNITNKPSVDRIINKIKNKIKCVISDDIEYTYHKDLKKQYKSGLLNTNIDLNKVGSLSYFVDETYCNMIGTILVEEKDERYNKISFVSGIIKTNEEVEEVISKKLNITLGVYDKTTNEFVKFHSYGLTLGSMIIEEISKKYSICNRIKKEDLDKFKKNGLDWYDLSFCESYNWYNLYNPDLIVIGDRKMKNEKSNKFIVNINTLEVLSEGFNFLDGFDKVKLKNSSN